MKLEKIINFIENAETADLLITFILIAIGIAIIASVIYIAYMMKRIYTINKRELETINRHLSHIDHNPYNYDRKAYDKSKENI